MENRLMEMFSTEKPEEETKVSEKKTKHTGRTAAYNSGVAPKKMQGLQMTEEEIAYCKLRAKEEKALHPEMKTSFAGFIRYLIRTDMENHPDTVKKANKIVALENS